jgi:hypothetical protein
MTRQIWATLRKSLKIIAAAPLPPLTGEAIDLAIAGFVALVYASGGGTITPDPDPIHDAQTTPTPHSGKERVRGGAATG